MFTNFALPILLLIATLIFGIWLSSRGKPYPGLLFNIHKLTALAGLVLAIIKFIPFFRSIPNAASLTTALALIMLGVLALFISGGLMSANKLKFSLMLLIHRAGLVLLLLTLVWLIVLLGKLVH